MPTPPDDAPVDPRLTHDEYAAVLDHLVEGVFMLRDGVFRYVNHALAAMAGGRPADIVGLPLLHMIAPEDHAVVADRYRRRAAGEQISPTYEFSVLCLDRVTRLPVFMQTGAYRTPAGLVSAGTVVPLAHRDALVAAAREHASLEDDASLAIPVLQLHAHALVVPLVGRIHAARARVLMDRLLAAIADRRAREVILDITGVPFVDQRVATYLVHTAAAVRLLGAHLTLAGITPAIARTLITLDVDLHSLDTTASLADAWHAASRRLA